MEQISETAVRKVKPASFSKNDKAQTRFSHGDCYDQSTYNRYRPDRPGSQTVGSDRTDPYSNPNTTRSQT